VRKALFIFFLALFTSALTNGQDSLGVPPQKNDTPVVEKAKPVARPDSTAKRNRPPLAKKDTGAKAIADSAKPVTLPSLSMKPQDGVCDTAFAWLRALHHAGRPGYVEILRANPWFKFLAPYHSVFASERHPVYKDTLFYLLSGLLLFFAVVKLFFYKYVSNMLSLAFRGALRQKQLREQLLQAPLPSLLLNIFFVLVGGLYILFLLYYYGTAPNFNFWLTLLYSVLLVAIVYLVKFMVLKVTGWIFNMREAADTYIFIVFLVNKLLAIFLLPLLIVMAFSLTSWSSVLITLSYVMVGLFFCYRYILSFAPVRREVKVSQFHFFMYLCAFEIIPLLLIYKLLVHFL
jgi:hypothetical protein